MRKQITAAKGAAPAGPYSHAIICQGTLVFVSGQGPSNPETGEMPDTFEAAARQTLENVKVIVEAAGASHPECAQLLDDYEAAVLNAPARRFHVDPVLHAYAQTARRCDFDPEHVRAFFASMRRDLNQASHDRGSFDAYVYGSAEVIGLLCLQAFLVDHPVSDAERARLEAGARSLGSAFQKVNFLRDLREDAGILGRSYFPDIDIASLTEGDKARLVAEIRQELIDAAAVIPLLPPTARAGVLAATNLFTELNNRIAATPAADLTRRRISVPRPRKAAILAKAVVTSSRMKEARS